MQTFFLRIDYLLSLFYAFRVYIIKFTHFFLLIEFCVMIMLYLFFYDSCHRHWSKGQYWLQGKNTALLAGKPLASYPISAALQSQLVDDVFVSTDDDQIVDIALELGAQTIARPLNLLLILLWVKMFLFMPITP